MATPPTFTAGSVLTAAQMNAAGLWRITGATVTSTGGTAATASNGVITIGSGNTSLLISNAFSTDFLNYKMIINNVRVSADNSLRIQMGTTNTGYYGNLTYALYNAAGYTFVNANNANAMYLGLTGQSADDGGSYSHDIIQPYSARRTSFIGQYYARGYMGQTVGQLVNTTSYTSMTIFPESGSITSGTITIYGYN